MRLDLTSTSTYLLVLGFIPMARLITFHSLKIRLSTLHPRPDRARSCAPRLFARTYTSTNEPFPSSQPPSELFSALNAATSEQIVEPFVSATAEETAAVNQRPGRLYSNPSDLMLFVNSPFAAWMERLAREQPSHPVILIAPPEQDAMMSMLAAKGQEAELKFLDSEFVSSGKYGKVVDLSHTRDVAATMAAMQSGAGVIFQAPLSLDFPSIEDGWPKGGLKGFRGVADFLVKVPLGKSQMSTHNSDHGGFGSSYTYQVWDAKLTKWPAPSHVLQLWCYTDMVSQLAATSRAASSSPPVTNRPDTETAGSLNEIEAVSEVPPRAVLVLNAASTPTPIDLAPYGAYYRAAVKKFRAFHAAFDPSTGPPEPLPLPSDPSGRWANTAAALREQRDDLTRVARLPRRHADRLCAAAGISNAAESTVPSKGGSGDSKDSAQSVSTLSALAALPFEAVASTAASARLDPEVLDRHRRQAVLQQETKRRHINVEGDAPSSKAAPAWDWLEGKKSAVLLAAMLPPPSRGDVFFDLEGHPFADLVPNQRDLSGNESVVTIANKADASLISESFSTAEAADLAPMAVGSLVPPGSSLNALKVTELKELLKANNLLSSGRKADLVSRLIKAFSQAELMATEQIQSNTVDKVSENTEKQNNGSIRSNIEGRSSTNGSSGGGLVSREYLWGATVFDTAFDQDPTRQSSIITRSSNGATADFSDNTKSIPSGLSEFQSLESSLGVGVDGGLKMRYVCWWAHDADAEVEAFVGFVDWLMARRVEYPNLKVYHYGAYEVSALKRLAGRSGLREREVDTLLRDHVFVDVYTCVRKCLLIGEPKYSIKNVEKLYLGEDPVSLAQWASANDDNDVAQHNRRRNNFDADAIPTNVDNIPTNARRLREGAEVAKGDDSVAAYQRWLEQPDAPFAQEHAVLGHSQLGQIGRVRELMASEVKQAEESTILSQQLEALRAYNQDDTDSTLLAVLWLRRAVSQALGPIEKGSTAALAVTAVQVEGAAAERVEELAAARLADEERLDKLIQTLRNDQAPCWQLPPPTVDDLLGSSNEEAKSDLSLSAPTKVASRRARDTAADSLSFEQREARPVWWRRFAWLEASDKELFNDPDALAGLEILDAGDSDFAPTNRASSSNSDHDDLNSNDNDIDKRDFWAGLGPDGTCEPWKRSPRKKKLCVTYRFDPNTQAGKKVALQASAALQQVCANGSHQLPPPAAQLPFFLAVPSEEDCAPSGVAMHGEDASSELYDRMKPLRVSVIALDLARGLCLMELPPDRHPQGLSLLPDEFVSADPIPAAVRSTCEDWVNNCNWMRDPLYQFLAGHSPDLSFTSKEDSRSAPFSSTNDGSGGNIENYGVDFGRQDIVRRAAQHLAAKTSNEQDRGGGHHNSFEQPAELVSVADAATAAFNALQPWSYLAIQGPPGTGKTTLGARLVVEAVARGRRVAITANSHKVIVNLMAKVAYELARQGRSSSSLTCGGSQSQVIGMVKVGGALKEDVAEIAAAAARGEAEHLAGLDEDAKSKNEALVTVRGVVGAKDFVESDSDSSNDSSGSEKEKKASEVSGALKANDLVVGATAWGLSHPAMRGCADWLIVDEAGQVPVPRLLAMGQVLRKPTSSSSSRHPGNEENASVLGGSSNGEPGSGGLVLLGDQMQLPAPTEGTHPGLSGLSALEYLLTSPVDDPPGAFRNDISSSSSARSSNGGVLPGHMGIFLPLSFRLHPSLCRVISDQVYDGKLYSHSGAAQRSLCLLGDSSPSGKLIDQSWPSWPPLSNKEKPTSPERLLATGQGVSVLRVAHEQFNDQSSEEECEAVSALIQELLNPTRTLFDDFLKNDGGSGDEGPTSAKNRNGRPLTLNDILVVSPYNLQVKRLAARLGPSARVGTVDKFQGQEAPVVIISLATSSFDGTFAGPASSSKMPPSSLDTLLGHAADDGSEHGEDLVRAAVLEACQQQLSSGGRGSSRSLAFVLDMRRLNVALSRAQCVAVVVLSDQLAKSLGASSLDQMRALSFACRLLEGNGDDL